jgi:hypothetical protein
MDANAIRIVTKALQDLLTPIVGDVYVGPLDDPNAAGAKAMLFLYRVAVNADLRSSPHVVATPTSPPIVYENSLPLDLHYLVTAGTAQTGGELDALRVLGLMMQTLNATPNLVGLPVLGETVRLSLDPVGSEEMSRIWTLFPTANYRTSVVYVATPVWIDPAVVRAPGPPVVEEPHLVGQAG